ncbi:MAG: efflux RND transporter periplasmic adaptor subunit [Helicobacter sp.]|nr:efflux RND transporter periplasmic adaptor subunit [Helicobacter sp.]MDE7196537.1 efflux RND transporter periplasmic adaptor subunit [Helicobacter sp.]
MKISKQKTIATCICSAFLLWGCGGSGEQTQAAPQQRPAIKADTVKISKGAQNLQFEYPARVRSMGAVEVYAKVAGTLLEQLYKEGDFVEKDTPLFRIDADIYQAAYNEALAALETRQATFNQAEREWQRVSKLFEQKAVSQKEHDNAFAAFESARANIANAEATLARAELNLSYTTVTAPVSGMSGVKLQDVGAYVGTAGSTMVTTITQTAPIYIEFSIADSQAIDSVNAVRTGKIETKLEDLSVRVLSRQGEELDSGRLDFIDSRIDESIGSIKLRAIVPNEKNRLIPGQFVRVTIDGIKIPDSAVIPQKAVMQTAQGTFIYLLKDGIAKIVPINIAQSLARDFIITGMFEDGDELITNNLMKIRPDSPVQAEGGAQ